MIKIFKTGISIYLTLFFIATILIETVPEDVQQHKIEVIHGSDSINNENEKVTEISNSEYYLFQGLIILCITPFVYLSVLPIIKDVNSKITNKKKNKKIKQFYKNNKR